MRTSVWCAARLWVNTDFCDNPGRDEPNVEPPGLGSRGEYAPGPGPPLECDVRDEPNVPLLGTLVRTAIPTKS